MSPRDPSTYVQMSTDSLCIDRENRNRCCINVQVGSSTTRIRAPGSDDIFFIPLYVLGSERIGKNIHRIFKNRRRQADARLYGLPFFSISLADSCSPSIPPKELICERFASLAHSRKSAEADGIFKCPFSIWDGSANGQAHPAATGSESWPSASRAATLNACRRTQPFMSGGAGRNPNSDRSDHPPASSSTKSFRAVLIAKTALCAEYGLVCWIRRQAPTG